MSENRYLEGLRRKLMKVAPSQKLESLARNRSGRSSEESAFESASSASVDKDVQLQTEALRKMENGDFDLLSPREQLGLEAIVEEDTRPVAFIIGNSFQNLPAPWTHYNSGAIRQTIETATPAIGRVELPAMFVGASPRHLGTGFIVGPNLMMTNRHVAEIFVRGVGRNPQRMAFVPGVTTAINFKREQGFRDDDGSGTMLITDIVIVHPYWDMALFRVDGAIAVTPLTLAIQAPEDLADREVAVIGYPARSRDRSTKAVELEQKHFGDVFGVKRIAPGEIRQRERIESFEHLVPAMTHDSSTLPGNSGSAIVDVSSGFVLGLHFAGITLRANYSVPAFELARDQRVIDAGVAFEKGGLPQTIEWENFWKLSDPDNEAGGRLTSGSGVNSGGSVAQPSQGTSGTATWTIPITVSVSLGNAAMSSSGVAQPPNASVAVQGMSATEASFQIPIIHDGLDSRTGYDPGFLQLDGGVDVPLPTLTQAGEQLVSRLDDGTSELKYHRFSVVMHKKRRLALFTAANGSWIRDEREINGRKPTRKELTGIPDGVSEEWMLDERIPAMEQLPDLFFTKDGGAFDKGHLIRRDDVAWGASFDDMQKSNGDTFHVTNCSPQVLQFNRSSNGKDNWGDLENMVQKQAKAEHVIIFAGPVLSKFDRIFKGLDENGPVKIQIPQQFWKIIVAKTDEGPKAFGFVLKQKLTDVPLEFTVPEDWEPYQTPIQEIEYLLFDLVTLDWCKEHDTLRGSPTNARRL
jgi:endonuclease G